MGFDKRLESCGRRSSAWRGPAAPQTPPGDRFEVGRSPRCAPAAVDPSPPLSFCLSRVASGRSHGARSLSHAAASAWRTRSRSPRAAAWVAPGPGPPRGGRCWPTGELPRRPGRRERSCRTRFCAGPRECASSVPSGAREQDRGVTRWARGTPPGARSRPRRRVA